MLTIITYAPILALGLLDRPQRRPLPESPRLGLVFVPLGRIPPEYLADLAKHKEGEVADPWSEIDDF